MRLIRLLKNDLARESAQWVEQGLITRQQAEAICAVYGADYSVASQAARGYRVLVVLGYGFIGLALITLLSANWDTLPRALRMGGLLCLTVAVNGAALWLFQRGRDRAAERLFGLGTLVYGASIILIAQIYHLGEHMPDGVFWWALGGLPAALLLRSPGLALLVLCLAAIWSFIELQLGYYPMTFALFLVSAGYVLWAGRRSVLLFLALVGSLGFWLEASLSAHWADGPTGLAWHAEQLPVGVAYFALAYAVSHGLNAQPGSTARDYATVLSLWILRFALFTLFVLSYHGPWRSLIRADWAHQGSMWAVVAVLAVAALLVGQRVGKAVPVAVAVGSAMAVFAAVANLAEPEHALAFQVLSNLVIVAFAVWLVVAGVRDGESQAFFLGVAAIVLLALLRYIDLIGDYVGTAALFIVMACVLLGAARYWRTRQRLGDDT